MNDNIKLFARTGASYDFYRCLPLFVCHQVFAIRSTAPQGRHLRIQIVGADCSIRVTEYCFCPQ